MKPAAFLAAIAALTLAGCGEEHQDLRKWIKDTDGMARPRIEPLPEVKPYEPFTYNAFDMLDPFKPRKVEQPKSSSELLLKNQIGRAHV